MSEIKVNKISPSTGTDLDLGDSGDSLKVPSGGFLKVNNIEAAVHYPIPPHKQVALQRFNHLKFPITEKIHETCVSLPISPIMTSLEVDTVIEKLNNY